MDLLPRQVNSFGTGKAVQCMRFNGVENTLRLALGGHKVKPPAGGKRGGIQFQNIFRNRIASAETIEQPAIQFFLLQRGLKRLNQLFIHRWPPNHELYRYSTSHCLEPLCPSLPLRVLCAVGAPRSARVLFRRDASYSTR